MSSPTGVREVSGEVSFDRQWTLKFLRTDGSSFTATGSIANPMISSEAPPKVAEAR